MGRRGGDEDGGGGVRRRGAGCIVRVTKARSRQELTLVFSSRREDAGGA